MLNSFIQRGHSILCTKIDQFIELVYFYEVDKTLGDYGELVKYLVINILREWEEIVNRFQDHSVRFLEIFSRKNIRHLEKQRMESEEGKEFHSLTSPQVLLFSQFQSSQKEHYIVSHIPCELEGQKQDRENLRNLVSCKMIGKDRKEKYTIECLNQRITFGRISGQLSSGSHAFKNAFAALSVADGLCHSEAFVSNDFYKIFENFILKAIDKFREINTLDYEVTCEDLRIALQVMKGNSTTELKLFTDLASRISVLDKAEDLVTAYKFLKSLKCTEKPYIHAYILPKKVEGFTDRVDVNWMTMIYENDGQNTWWYELDSNPTMSL